MKPMQMIKEECANWRDGRCTGAYITKALAVPFAQPRPRCAVLDGQPCPYFEDCVAPMADAVSDRRREDNP